MAASHPIRRAYRPWMASTTYVVTEAPIVAPSRHHAKLLLARRAVVPQALPQYGGAISRVTSGAPDPTAPGVPVSSSSGNGGAAGTGSDCCG